MTIEMLGMAALIFGARVVNNAISTIRLVVLSRGLRNLATILAFFESLLYVLIFAEIMSDIDNALNIIAYAGGYATGGYIGQVLEIRLVSGHVTVNIIVSKLGHELATALREQGYGVTETLGEGAGGTVSILRSVIKRQDVAKMLLDVRKIDAAAFVTVEEARSVYRGWIREGRINQRT